VDDSQPVVVAAIAAPPQKRRVASQDPLNEKLMDTLSSFASLLQALFLKADGGAKVERPALDCFNSRARAVACVAAFESQA
jgi:hypothetical protein